jgi:hypothetical protein
MLVYCKFTIMLCFYLFYHDLSLIIGHDYVMQCCLNKNQFFIMFTSYIRQYSVYMLFINCRIRFKLLTDSLFIAICRSNWLYSRKYELSGTTRQVPVLSNYFHPLSVSGKIDWHASGFDARATCMKLANPACFVLREVLILRQQVYIDGGT